MSSHSKEPEVITIETGKGLGLTEEEYQKIVTILGRTPNYTELGIFSVMWSEHCSYKNSITELKKLPRSGKRLLVGAGEENAGLVDIGSGLAISFKIESHNHPSAVEPYQGAATGVGGIMRDIFTMGARPFASLNSLRFGSLDEPNVKYLFKNVVKGIGDYGNCLGIPTVSGEVFFDPTYNANPLVNAMSVGIVEHGKVAKAIASGPGNPVFIIGSATGKDGIHGATFASEEISEESESKRPSVQVGDPFTEKLLLEATLELIESGCVVGIQDMGAAGLTCSSSEMSAKAETGMELWLDKVPLREKGMTPYEIMLSESQERMLVVVKKGSEKSILDICQKWDLNCEQIGVVTKDRKIQLKWDGKDIGNIPAWDLVLGGGAPVYQREAKEPEYIKKIRDYNFNALFQPTDCNSILIKLLASPNLASKEWVYHQYDSMVRTNSVVLPGGDAAVVRIKGTQKAISVKTDCNARYVYLNPRRGAAIAVAESARNVVVTGAEPLAITDCLNFGNPYKPEIFWQFKEAVAGIGEACRFLDTPVTGGNVSFYNENPIGAVYPTPVIGMLGLIEDIHFITTSHFKDEGDVIILLGKTFLELGGSEYLSTIHGLVTGDCPLLDFDLEKRTQQSCLEAIRSGIVKSAHDVADGGLAIGLAECCFQNRDHPIGATVHISSGLRDDFLLFSESQSRIILSTKEKNVANLRAIAKKHNIPFEVIGKVGGENLVLNDLVDCSIANLADVYYRSIPKIMGVE